MDSRNVYQQILNVLNLTEPDLVDLKPFVRNLRNSFKTSEVKNEGVYCEDQFQKAYLLAYFPPYTGLIGKALEELYDSERVCFNKLAFIGCGLGPEIYGFMRFIADKTYLGDEEIEISRFDFSKWNRLYESTTNRILQHMHHHITDKFYDIDFKNQLDENHLNKLTESNFIIIQNMLNEIISDDDLYYDAALKKQKFRQTNWKNNLNKLIDGLKIGSYLIIIDLSQYNNTNILLQEIIDQSNYLKYSVSIQKSVSEHLDVVPQIILKNLLDRSNGLIPRKWVDHVRLIIKRTNEFSELTTENETKLRTNFPDVTFNFDKKKCKDVLSKVVCPDYYNISFVAGGFFTSFDENSVFAKIFPHQFADRKSEYGMSIFFHKVEDQNFGFKDVIDSNVFNHFTLKPKLDIFNFKVMTAKIDDLTVYINLSTSQTGFDFLKQFDYESSKIFYLPAEDNLMVSNELLNGKNKSSASTSPYDLLLANEVRLKERLLTQKFKNFLDQRDKDFISSFKEYMDI